MYIRGRSRWVRGRTKQNEAREGEARAHGLVATLSFVFDLRAMGSRGKVASRSD